MRLRLMFKDWPSLAFADPFCPLFHVDFHPPFHADSHLLFR